MSSSQKSTKTTTTSAKMTTIKSSPTGTQARSSQTMVQHLPMKGGFLTAHIVGEDYGEMNPKFISSVYEELDSTLTIFDETNRKMKVGWNGSCEHPLILKGWNKLRSFFGITGNKMILMTYVGTSCFYFEILPQPFRSYNLPSYHSYRYFHTDITSFDVKLTAYLVKGSQLTLTKDFAAYIRKTKYKTIKLYGPSGDEFSCLMLLRKRSTKIGEGWKEFVDKNSFEEGEVLNFKFVNKNETNVMRVIVR